MPLTIIVRPPDSLCVVQERIADHKGVGAQAGEAEGQVVHRLESGVWVRVPSVTVGNNVQGTTPRFSAYQSFIVSVPPPPPPPDANFTLNDVSRRAASSRGCVLAGG
eukprot:156262-Rhodomonas_salina.2